MTEVRNRARVTAAAGAAAAALGACASTTTLDPIPAQALQQCAEDSTPVLLEERPSVTDLLLLGTVEDPALTDGRIIVGDSTIRLITPEVTDFMEGLNLQSVDVYMAVRPPESGGHLFGPKEPDQPGLYRLIRHSDAPDRCSEYWAVTASVAASHRLEPGSTYRSTILSDPNECLSYERVGDRPDLDQYSHVAYVFNDLEADRAGYGRRVEELRDRTSAVVARAAIYTFRRPPWTCGTAPLRSLSSLFTHGPA